LTTEATFINITSVEKNGIGKKREKTASWSPPRLTFSFTSPLLIFTPALLLVYKKTALALLGKREENAKTA